MRSSNSKISSIKTQNIKDYQNMVRAQAKQALADTIACELYISTLGTFRKAQIQSIIDDNIISPRMRLDKIMTTHWNEVKTKIPTIIANFKQQWEIYQVRSNDLTTIMTNLNILQEINKQVNNFDPKEIYTGLQMIQKLMPTLVAREFNAMSGEWQNSIDRNRATTITQVAEDSVERNTTKIKVLKNRFSGDTGYACSLFDP